MKIKITNSQIQEILTNQSYQYPKYATQIMNLANQNAQGTRPRVVGQMSELIQEFDGCNIEEWEKWYGNRYPDSIECATDRVYAMIEHLKESINLIDRDMVKCWIEELVIVKTYAGLKFQEAILRKLAEVKQTTYQLATPEEESQGIDGYVGNVAVSIKATTYSSKDMLPEQIDVEMVYYEKRKTEIVIEYNF